MDASQGKMSGALWAHGQENSLPSSSVHGILQARVLEWVAISFSRGSSRPRDWTLVSCIAGRFFINWATREGENIFCSIVRSCHFPSPYSFVVQSLRHVRLFVTLWTAAHQSSLSFIISQSLLKLMSIESTMPFNHLIFHHPFLLLLSIFPSIRVFPFYLATPFLSSLNPSSKRKLLFSL